MQGHFAPFPLSWAGMKTMAESIAAERLRWIKPILDKEIQAEQMVKVCPFSERTIKYWLAAFRKEGLKGLEPKSTRPKTCPWETPIAIKEQVLALRKDTSLAAIKLHWKLAKLGTKVPCRTIGKIISDEGLVRRYRTKKITYRYVKAGLRPGELVEIDIKYVPDKINGFKYYQFTAIDCASRWRYLRIFDDASAASALEFFDELLGMAPFRIRAVKTDNGACFTNRYIGYANSSDPFNAKLHPLDIKCQGLGIIHYLIDPGKPAQNGKVERSHRTDQEHFYNNLDFANLTVRKLKSRLKAWNECYNNTEHCALNGLTPNEALRVQNVLA